MGKNEGQLPSYNRFNRLLGCVNSLLLAKSKEFEIVIIDNNSPEIPKGLVEIRDSHHLPLLLIEAAGGICKGAVGHKLKDLRATENGNSSEVIAYADKANTRLRSWYYNL